jgi:hypothetical protein
MTDPSFMVTKRVTTNNEIENLNSNIDKNKMNNLNLKIRTTDMYQTILINKIQLRNFKVKAVVLRLDEGKRIGGVGEEPTTIEEIDLMVDQRRRLTNEMIVITVYQSRALPIVVILEAAITSKYSLQVTTTKIGKIIIRIITQKKIILSLTKIEITDKIRITKAILKIGNKIISSTGKSTTVGSITKIKEDGLRL